MSAEVAAWVAYYNSGYFTRAYLEQQVQELQPGGGRQFSYGKQHEREPRLAAINYLLSLPAGETSIPA